MLHRATCSTLATGFALLMLCAPPAGALPTRFQADFSITAQGMEVAHSRWSLDTDAQGVRTYSTDSESVGLARLLRDQKVAERSRFEIAAAQVRPLRYDYQRSGKKKRSAKVVFDWQASTGENTINGDHWSMSLTPGMQDKLSYLMAIMLAVETTGQPPPRITLSDGGKLKSYALTLVGRAVRSTVLGDLETLHIRRTTDDDPRITDLWLAPSLSFLPVHIEHTEDGETVTATLQSLDNLARE